MTVKELSIPGCFEFVLQPWPDERGLVVEAMRRETFAAAVGHSFDVAQVNISVSRRGVIRGVHYVALPGQAKYVSCLRGEVLDVLVDLRLGSPTFGRSETLSLSEHSRSALYIPIGVGHAYLSLTDDSTVLYLMSAQYVAERQRTVHPLDPALALPWEDAIERADLILSPLDSAAPGLAEAERLGLLLPYDECLRLDAQD